MKKDEVLRLAFEDGFRSGEAGEDPRVCPHDKMAAEWQAWNAGQHWAAIMSVQHDEAEPAKGHE